jgi:hypothetical protein
MPNIVERRWLIAVVAVLALEVAIYVSMAAMPISSADAEELVKGARQLLEGVQGVSFVYQVLGIFTNNIRIAALEFVPALGWVIFLASATTTGRVLAALASSSQIPWQLIALSLFASPHAWLEFIAYSIAVTQGTFLIYSWRKKRLLFESLRTLFAILAVLIMLLFAAFLETITLSFGLSGDILGWALLLAAAYPAYRIAEAISPRRTDEAQREGQA